jgi:predicted TIM-barrel fold metal-dependent hydrolase
MPLAEDGRTPLVPGGLRLIDVHVHLHPPRLYAAIRRWFAERTTWSIEHATEPAAVAAALRAAGVERFVFCSYAHKTGMARELNAWLAQTARELDRYGLPLATVHLDDSDPAGDLATAFDDGCIGLKIHEDVQRLAVDDPRFDPIFATVAEREGFVLAHIGHVPWSNDTNDGPARIARVLDRHPRLRFVVAHFGVPDWAGYAAVMPQRPNLFLDTTMAFTADSPLFAGAGRAFVESIGDAIVFGTDYPNIPHAYGSDFAGLEALDLDPATLRKIARENARRLAPVLAEERPRTQR